MGASHVYPVGADNGDGVAKFAGQHKGFDVEGPAVYTGTAEDFLGRFGRERLEAALRVPNAGHSHDLDEEIAQIAQHALDEGLRGGLAGVGVVFAIARANDDGMALLEQRPHLVEMAHIGRVIGIGEEADLACGGQHAFADGVPFALVFQAVNPTKVFFTLGELF